MGAWGFGPFESDDGADVVDEVVGVLEPAWEPLRADEITEADLARAAEAAEIVRALAASGIEARPEDREDLVDAWDDDLPAVIVAALTAECADDRPPFAGERGVERWLRDNGAPYDVWMAGAAFGDDRRAAWAATTEVRSLLLYARLAGVADATVAGAVATCLLPLLGESAEDKYVTTREVLARLAAGMAVDDITLGRLRAQQKQQQDERSAAYAAARDRGERLPDDSDPRPVILVIAVSLAARDLARAQRSIELLETTVTDLGVRLRPHLEPVVAGRL